jgi:hypothetical protein
MFLVLCGHDGQVQQGEQKVPHVRVSVGQTWGTPSNVAASWIRREYWSQYKP